MPHPPRTRSTPAVVAGLAAAGAAFVLLPLLALIVRAPWSDAWSLVSSETALTALRVSVVVSLLAALLSVLLGAPLGWILARARFRGRSVLRAVVILPLVLPPVVAGIGLLAALGRRGLVGRLLYEAGIQLTFSTAGAVVAATFVSMPLVVIAVEAGLRSLDERLEDAAATLGASPGFRLRHVVLPLLRPQLVAGAILAWARALGEFGATITFAGNLQGRTQTLPLAVFEARQTDPGAAIVVSLLLVALSVGVLVAMRDRLLAR
ncbi:MAG: ABC transporter permease [Actinomycetota bacterium]